VTVVEQFSASLYNSCDSDFVQFFILVSGCLVVEAVDVVRVVVEVVDGIFVILSLVVDVVVDAVVEVVVVVEKGVVLLVVDCCVGVVDVTVGVVSENKQKVIDSRKLDTEIIYNILWCLIDV